MPSIRRVILLAQALLTAFATGARAQHRSLSWTFLPAHAHTEWEAYDLVVKSTYGTDTIPNQTGLDPVRIGDTLLVGLVVGDSGRQFFRYDARSHRVALLPLPTDVWFFFNDVAISPAGKYVVYLARIDTANQVVVREWPHGSVVVRGPLEPDCECDVDSHHAHWVTPDSFEVATSIDEQRHLWLRVAGNVRTRRVRTDTLRTDPRWP